MSFHVTTGNAPSIEYAGRPMEVLAGLDGRPAGFAVAELTIPPGFAGPPPHAHDGFDEGIYVLEGSIVVVGDDEPTQAQPGSLFVAHAGRGTASRTRRIERRGSWGCGVRPARRWSSCRPSEQSCRRRALRTSTPCARSTNPTRAASSRSGAPCGPGAVTRCSAVT